MSFIPTLGLYTKYCVPLLELGFTDFYSAYKADLISTTEWNMLEKACGSINIPSWDKFVFHQRIQLSKIQL